MATLGLRHAVLWVSDPAVSADFYHQALGLEAKMTSDDRVFMASPLSATDHDLGLFRTTDDRPGPRAPGLYHLAWEVATLAELAAARERLSALGALVGETNHGPSRSLYCHDPDGIEFEIMWEVPLELLKADEPANIPLDLDADIARWGPDQAGRGVGVSGLTAD